LRSGGPDLGRQYPRPAHRLRPLRRHRDRILARDGPGPAHVRPRGHHRRRADPCRRYRGGSAGRGDPGGPVRRAGRRTAAHGRLVVVAHVVRLRLWLLGHTLRKRVWQMIGMILGCLYALYMVGMITVGAIAGGAAAPERTPLIIVAGGAVIVLAWWIIPSLA